MPPRLLYQRLCQEFRESSPELGVSPTRRLALLVTGLLLARHTALPRVAAQLRRVNGTTHADSIERRLRRTLGVTEFGAARVFEHVVCASLGKLAPGQYLLLLDDTQQTTRCTLSTLALAYGGRSLPLAWCRWSGRLHGAYWSQIDQLFDQAGRLLPPQVRPVVVADRGLASPALIHLVEKHGWDYLLRVTSDVTMRLPEQPRQVLHLGKLLNEPGGPALQLTGWIFQKKRVWAHTLAVWQRGHQEPWLLVSNLDLGERLAELYARRMQVEALFRDAQKGGGGGGGGRG